MTVSVRPQEFSVVYTDRALNHMSAPFKRVMLDIGDMLKEVYHAEHAVIIPGSGTYAMEACARHFATNKKAMVLRNGYFSYRWTHIFETCGIPAEEIVVKARPVSEATPLQYAPCPIDELEEMIAREKPAVVFAPHVETSTGILLPDDYIKRATAAVHAQGGLFVLDCIASGTVWANMARRPTRGGPSPPPLLRTRPSCLVAGGVGRGRAHLSAAKGVDGPLVRRAGHAEQARRRGDARDQGHLVRGAAAASDAAGRGPREGAGTASK